MSQRNSIDVMLPIRCDDGAYASPESIPVEQIAVNRFRLLQSPGFVSGLAAGDEIELQPETKIGFQILKRAGNVCVWFFFEQKGQEQSLAAQQLCRDVQAVGGWLDGGAHYLLIFTIPISVGFAAIEKLFHNAEVQIPGSTWMYGNVYDSEDGQTPLDWWL